MRLDPGSRNTPLIVAHRGSSGSAPENTIPAFQRAIDEGCDMIELDVRMTKDFELVVHHDKSVRRTTDGKGNIWDLKLEEVRRLDAGSWYGSTFTRKRTATRETRTHVPMLREVIDLLPNHIDLNIEVKTDGDPRGKLAFEEALILLLREKQFSNRVLVSSFDHKFLKRLHALDPSIRIGALYLPVRDLAKTPSQLQRSIGAVAFICSCTQLRKRHVEDARKYDILIGCYTVNTRAQLDRLLNYRIDAIVTDFPAKIRRMLRSPESDAM